MNQAGAVKPTDAAALLGDRVCSPSVGGAVGLAIQQEEQLPIMTLNGNQPEKPSEFELRDNIPLAAAPELHRCTRASVENTERNLAARLPSQIQ